MFLFGDETVCPQPNAKRDLKVKDVYDQHDIRVFESETMQEAANRAQNHLSLIPVFDYSNQYIGALQTSDFVEFQSQYFENLKFCDRRNEFLFENGDSSDIHFVPIDQVSRYVNKDIQPVSWNEPVAEVLRQLVERKITALPVMDDDQSIVGSISLAEIIQAENLGNSPPTQVKSANDSTGSCRN